jgi:trehalose 6-phosphate phosphatase
MQLDDILTPEWTGQARIGLVTDVDGTISPIVDQPDAARVTERSRELLAALANRLALAAVISGRAAGDVRDRVGLAQVVYVGNHGMERWADGRTDSPPEVQVHRPALEAVRDALEADLLPGMHVEDKIATLSLHYRQAADPDAAYARFKAIVPEVAAEHGLRAFEGRMIFEVRPPVDVNKGTAFGALVREYQLGAALYIGDDTTDVDAMATARRLREEGKCLAYGIGVRADETPAAVLETADYVVDGVAGVESFLAAVLSSVLKASSASST